MRLLNFALILSLSIALTRGQEGLSVQELLEQWHKYVSDISKETLKCDKETKVDTQDSNVAMEMVECSEQGATREYLFEENEKGNFLKSGHYQGYGVMSTWGYEKDSDGMPGIHFATLEETQKEEDRQSPLCLRTRKMFSGSKHIWRISSNFVKGKPHGLVKVTFSDKEIAWINFFHGVPHGMYRHFNQDGALLTVGEVSSGTPGGPCWTFEADPADGTVEFKHGVCDHRGLTSYKAHSFILLGRLGEAEVGAGIRVATATVKGRIVGRHVLEEGEEVDLVRFAQDDHCVPYVFSKPVNEQGPLMKINLLFGVRTHPEDSLAKEYCYTDQDTEWNSENPVSGLTMWLHNLLSYTQIQEDPFWPWTNDTTTLDKKRKKLVSGLEKSGDAYEAVLAFPGAPGASKEAFEFQYDGPLSKKGLFHGVGTLKVSRKQMCLRGQCGLPLLEELTGHFIKGKLTGRTKVVRKGKIHYLGLREDSLHGLRVSLGQQFADKTVAEGLEDLLRRDAFHLLARYENGKPVGKIWLALPGGGFLYGQPDPEEPDTVTDPEGAYIYPGMRVALLGQFTKNKMEKTRPARIKQERCSRGLKELEFELLGEGEFGSELQIHLPDPLETDNVKVKDSGIGLEAARDLGVGSIAAFYSGTKHHVLPSQDSGIAIPLKPLPSALAVYIEQPTDPEYRASLGHLVQVADTEGEANAVLTAVEHPRLGVVPGIVLKEAVDSGKEILLDPSWQRTVQSPKDEL